MCLLTLEHFHKKYSKSNYTNCKGERVTEQIHSYVGKLNFKKTFNKHKYYISFLIVNSQPKEKIFRKKEYVNFL